MWCIGYPLFRVSYTNIRFVSETNSFVFMFHFILVFYYLTYKYCMFLAADESSIDVVRLRTYINI